MQSSIILWHFLLKQTKKGGRGRTTQEVGKTYKAILFADESTFWFHFPVVGYYRRRKFPSARNRAPVTKDSLWRTWNLTTVTPEIFYLKHHWKLTNTYYQTWNNLQHACGPTLVFNGENFTTLLECKHNTNNKVTFDVCILTNHDPAYRGEGGGGGGGEMGGQRKPTFKKKWKWHFRNNLETRKFNFFFTFNFVTSIDWKQANWKQTDAHYIDSSDFSAFNNKNRNPKEQTPHQVINIPTNVFYLSS